MSEGPPSQRIDGAQAVRIGEELNRPRLETYLRTHLNLDVLSVQQFPSGFSNLTYKLKTNGLELVLRRPPFGAAIKSAHDMAREYRVLSGLSGLYPTPKPLLFCEDESIIGAPFYVMERVRGVILRGAKPTEAPQPHLMASVASSLVKSLAELHAVDVEAANLSSLGKPEGYVARQVHGWTKRYRAAQTDAVTSVDAVAKWLAENMPAESGHCLIHNDFKYDNVVLNPERLSDITAVLDWEMCTVGDPLLDLGTSLGYWVQADDPEVMQRLALSPTMWPGNPTRAQVLELYQEATGCQVAKPVFYYVYGLFKVAVIVQQIYARYKAGLTRDERFAKLDQAVKACGEMAARALDKGSV